jgi:hypothetical protein
MAVADALASSAIARVWCLGSRCSLSRPRSQRSARHPEIKYVVGMLRRRESRRTLLEEGAQSLLGVRPTLTERSGDGLCPEAIAARHIANAWQRRQGQLIRQRRVARGIATAGSYVLSSPAPIDGPGRPVAQAVEEWRPSSRGD